MIRNSAALEVRADERDDDRDAGSLEGVCCGVGSGDVAVAKSRVAMLSVFSTGFPQAEQKRTLSDSSVAQNGHFTVIVPEIILTATVYPFPIHIGRTPRPPPRNEAPSMTAGGVDSLDLRYSAPLPAVAPDTRRGGIPGYVNLAV